MLSVTHTFTAPPFIQRAQGGFLRAFPALRFCLAEFDRQAFRPADFLLAEIPFPPPLRAAAAKRQAEYLAGRYCAAMLLQQAGVAASALPFSRSAPLWPAGWRGSISHTDDRAIAVLAPVSSGLAPGIDIENARPEAMPELAPLFAAPAERAVIGASALADEQGLLALFSAKESLYKALWPQVQQFFGFDAAALIAIDTRRATLSLQLTRSLAPTLPRGAIFTARYQLDARGVIVALCAALTAASPPPTRQ
ncbi:4'-phosphopantetheinyl transferase [Mixta tenebrionis]|uniref:Enterobactin synthase component D n=1 Tax=Mixta tenebrionis TaxID=2562439 RepID=A0A506VBH0_9GAMM|nr:MULTISPECIES: 4'-phosphopantetheinyl transferase superfamily protein [Mixta]QHM74835.1 Enterobactin synthase component D [Mixta theicola]TPW42856.1 4'-phosphopantetheinyl transferase superfamily protein [Mixta tenebrionis]